MIWMVSGLVMGGGGENGRRGDGESVIDMGDGERRGDGASFSPQLDDYLPDVYGRLPVLVDADILAVEVADMLQL